MSAEKFLSADVTQQGLLLWNEGNHNDRGDYHPQYRLPEMTTQFTDADDTWHPLIDRTISANKVVNLTWPRFDTTFLIHDTKSNSPDQIAGIVRVFFSVKDDNSFYCGAKFNSLGPTLDDTNSTTRWTMGEDLVRIYVTEIDVSEGTYRVRVFLRGSTFTIYTLKFLHIYQDGNVYTPAALASPHMLTNYRYLVQNFNYLILRDQAPIQFSELPAETGVTTLVRSESSESVAKLSSLPTANRFWNGKNVIVRTSDYGDVVYRCVELSSAGIFRWALSDPIWGFGPPSSGTWSHGDRVENRTPTVQGTAGSQYTLQGWTCTAAGTPGTWSERRTLTGT